MINESFKVNNLMQGVESELDTITKD